MERDLENVTIYVTCSSWKTIFLKSPKIFNLFFLRYKHNILFQINNPYKNMNIIVIILRNVTSSQFEFELLFLYIATYTKYSLEGWDDRKSWRFLAQAPFFFILEINYFVLKNIFLKRYCVLDTRNCFFGYTIVLLGHQELLFGYKELFIGHQELLFGYQKLFFGH